MSHYKEDTNPLSDNDREALSAMLDGEAESLEIRRMLKLSASSDENSKAVAQTWSRYNSVQEAIRGEASGFQHLDISQAVSSAIASESPLQASEPLSSVAASSSPSGWGKSLRGLAVAASVAVVTVIGVNVLQQGGVSNLPVEGNNAPIVAMDDSVQPASPTQPRATFTTGANSQLAAFGSQSIPANEDRFQQNSALSTYDLSQAKERRAQELRKMEGYLLKHSQKAAMSNSTHGMIPMARVVNYETP